MDGNTADLERQTAEKIRQDQVYARAMASLERKRALKEGEGLALMVAMDSFAETIAPGTKGDKAVKLAKMALVLFVGVTANLLFYVYALGS